ncbi:MAG TPA: hypothetical protein VFS43_00440 [Polyangiaceae bacterium]|nr:hypothetical protein [Polyangiaceae bacterium]
MWGSHLHRRLRREGGGYESTCDVAFETPLDAFGTTVEGALERARKVVEAGGASIDGTPLVELRLATMTADFSRQGAVSGSLRFEGRLAEAPAFPFAFEGPADAFYAALQAASEALRGDGIVAEQIQETPGFWVFPTLAMAGALGAFFDRRTGRTVVMGSSMPIERWLWGYERGLVEEGGGVLVVTEVRDRKRTIEALRWLGVGFKSWHLVDLPFRLPGAASRTAVSTLHAAGDAFVWHVERPSAPA